MFYSSNTLLDSISQKTENRVCQSSISHKNKSKLTRPSCTMARHAGSRAGYKGLPTYSAEIDNDFVKYMVQDSGELLNQEKIGMIFVQLMTEVFISVIPEEGYQ